jgi:tetratricopeptide (TPR) repeat protein
MGAYGWGDVQKSELIEAVHAALDHGVNFFDTADTYGLGVSEKTLAEALGSHRSEVVISTKFGVVAGKGKTYYDRKQYKEAVDAYSRALKCNPNSYQAALDLARSYVSVNRSRYDKEHALKAYQKACKIRPSAIKLHLEAGNLAMRIEKWAVAVELYSRALSASPTSVEAVKGLVAALEKQGDSQAASVYRGYLRTLTKK